MVRTEAVQIVNAVVVTVPDGEGENERERERACVLLFRSVDVNIGCSDYKSGWNDTAVWAVFHRQSPVCVCVHSDRSIDTLVFQSLENTGISVQYLSSKFKLH